MAKRPINTKRANRLRKDLARTTPEAFIDVYKWLKLRKLVKNRDEATAFVLEGHLQVDGETVGVSVPEGDEDVYALKYLPSSMVGRIEVV